MAARKKPKMRDWKLVLADIRRTEREASDLLEIVAEFRETLDVMRKRLAFIRACVEKRSREKKS